MSTATDNITAEQLTSVGDGYLPGLLGVRFTHVERGRTVAEFTVRKELMAPNGFLHAGSVITLADTACGYGCVQSLPEGAAGFTTIELKSNFLSTAREGVVEVTATAQHLGRMTQLWDAEVRHRDTGKVMAHFRCTQMVLWKT